MNIPVELLYNIADFSDKISKIFIGCTCKDLYKYMRRFDKKTVVIEDIKIDILNPINLHILVRLEYINCLDNIIENILKRNSTTKIIFNRYLKHSCVTIVNGLIESMTIVYRGKSDELHSPMIDKILKLTNSNQYSENLTIDLFYDIDDCNLLDYHEIRIEKGKKFLENYFEKKVINISTGIYNISVISSPYKIDIPDNIYNKLRELTICIQEQPEYNFSFLTNLERITFKKNSKIKLTLQNQVIRITLQNIDINSEICDTNKIIE